MSDNELDAELLALAGGDESGSENEEMKPTNKQSKSPSPVPSPAAKVTKARPVKPQQKGVAQKKTSKGARVGRARLKDDTDDEGQASPAESAPDSLGSGAMSESEDDAAPAAKSDDGPLFPVDGKFYSDKDKAEILGMSEIKREEILAERAQLLERQTQDQHLRRLLQAREKDAAVKNKRKAGNAELEESPRQGTRQKIKAAENLEAYKRQRERRNDQRKQDEDRKIRDRDSPDQENGLSEGEADAESDVEWDNKPTKAPINRSDPVPDLRDYERIRVGRSNFAKVCFFPGFDDAIKGCYCRINIGPDKGTGQNQYRMTQIKEFTTGRLYAMEGPNGKPFHTDQYAVVTHGKAEKEWPFLACSDGKITDAEFDRYKRAMTTDNMRLSTMSFVNEKLDGINKLLNHVWTDYEINEKVKRSGVYAAKYAGIDRTRLLQDRQRLVEQGDEAAIARVDQSLTALDGPKLAFGTSLTSSASKPPAPKGASQQERLAAINKANRLAAHEQLRKAQLAEKRAERETQDKIARGEAQANPFARVKTRAKVHHDAPDGNGLQIPSGKALDDLFGGDGSDISRAGTPKPANGNGTSTPKTSKLSSVPTGIPSFKKRNMDDEILSEIDLGIDIEI